MIIDQIDLSTLDDEQRRVLLVEQAKDILYWSGCTVEETRRILRNEVVTLGNESEAELDRIVEAARAALEQDDREIEAGADRALDTHSLPRPLNLASLLAGPPPPTNWLWQGWIAKGDLALVVGDPGVGKSMVTLALAAAIRRGETFLGAECAKARVGILDFENPLAEAHKRMRGVGLSAEEHEGVTYFHAPDLDLLQQPETIGRLLDRHEIDVAIVDSLRRAAPGLDENDSRAVSLIFTPLRQLTARSERTVMVVHHARKRIGDNPTEAGQMVRGSGDLLASVDTLLFLRAKEAGTFTLEHGKSRRGLPHESILVRIEGDEDTIQLVNEGPVVFADDKIEGVLARVIEVLREAGGPLDRKVLSLRVDTGPLSGTLIRALKLGYQRNLIAKTNEATRKSTEPLLYALAEPL